jgi:hypothetical protein
MTALFPEAPDRGATISDDGLYRYQLWRRISSDPRRVLWIMLNPSTADADVDDPTIRRLIGYAKAWGFGRLDVVNLYAGRATKPADLWKMLDPVGPGNSLAVGAAAGAADLIVGGWGANAPVEQVEWLLRRVMAADLHALATTKAGQPRHPLYLKGDLTPTPWVMP